jgi:hypothetical protein
MITPWQELCDAVLDYANDKPVEKRIRLMRILADYAGDPDRTAELRQHAAELEAAHYRCRELHLKLTEIKTSTGNGGGN